MKLLIAPIILLILAPSIFAQCLNPTDNYASEVVLTKSGIENNLKNLDSAKNVLIENEKYILQSKYNQNLALIIEKQTGVLEGLSVRIQIPVKAEKKNFPYLKFISSSVRGKINLSEARGSFNGWEISCLEGDPFPQCEFKKERTSILANMVSSEKYDVTIETYEEFEGCAGCDGKCIYGKEATCIDKLFNEDIESVLRYSGLISSGTELFSTYRILSQGKTSKTEIMPEIDTPVDWEDAMETDLRYLKGMNILSIDDSDIKEISYLAKAGASGQNSRIFYDTSKEKWIYYYETDFPDLTKVQACNEFPISLVPTGAVAFDSENSAISAYYLVPLITTGVLFFVLIFLVVLARLISSKKSR